MIEWHSETWYSSLGTFIFLAVLLPIIFFYIGYQYVELAKVDSAAEISTLAALEAAANEFQRLTSSSTQATTTP